MYYMPINPFWFDFDFAVISMFIFAAHIFFDDAMELNEEGTEWMPNQFVHEFMECLDDAARYELLVVYGVDRQ